RREESAGARRRRRDRIRRVDLRNHRGALTNARAPEVTVVTEPRSPLELLEALAVEEVEVTPGLRHLEVYTLRGLLTLLWHGPRDARDVVVTCGGGMGSLLGPADALYHDLGTTLAARGIATLRVG